jgi:hypothetical protein
MNEHVIECNFMLSNLSLFWKYLWFKVHLGENQLT